MGKGNNNAARKSAAAAAAQQGAPGTEETGGSTKTSTTVNVLQLEDVQKYAELSKTGGMDHNHIMDMIRVQHETFRMDPKAAEHTGMSQEQIDRINRINAIEQVAIMASVVTFDNTPFAISVRSAQLADITEAAANLGIVIDPKALPAPNKDGQVEIPSGAIKVSSEKKDEIKAEREAAEKKVILDPTKIESEEQLKDSLTNILVKGNGNSNFYTKVASAISFYESYCKLKASKAEDKEEQLAALKEKSRTDLFSEIAKLLGKCTFTIGGMAKFMFEDVQRTKNPVTAFCQMRNASLNEKTGMPQIEDSLVAGITKVLIRWYADSEIEETNRCIATFEKDIEVLKKDAKKNATAIQQGNKKIENAKKHIEDIEAVVTCANMPDSSIVSSFAENYVNADAEGYKFARMMGSKIMGTYYPALKPKDVEQDNLIHNLQQYVGVIFNMFLPPMQKLTSYSEANITELVKVEPGEKKPEEKNS